MNEKDRDRYLDTMQLFWKNAFSPNPFRVEPKLPTDEEWEAKGFKPSEVPDTLREWVEGID